MGWWTDLAEKRGPVVNEGDGDGRPGELEDRAVECRGVILHIADGYYEGTIAWQHNPVAQVSSQFVVAGPRDVSLGTPDGRAGQCVDTDDRAWTQRDGNGHWLSIECSGFSGDALSPAQIEACARILAQGHQVYGYPLQLATSPTGRGLGHHSMGAESGANWGHSECPGERVKAQKPAILARAIRIVNGIQEDDMALEGLDRAQVSNTEHYLQSLIGMSPKATGISNVSVDTLEIPNQLVAAIRDIQAKLAAPTPVAVDAGAVATALAGNAAFLAALATAVNDEAHRRSAE
jgi:hypothetical protein